MPARVMVSGRWAGVEEILGHPGHSSQKSHGRRGGEDISGSIDYESLPPNYNVTAHTDDALGEILAKQGFDAAPEVVTRAEFDRAVAAGEVTESFRGLRPPAKSRPNANKTPEQLAEEYRRGPVHPGIGINGNGTYVAMRRGDAEYYGGTVLRIGLKKGARTIGADDLDAEMDAYFAGAKRSRSSGYVRDLEAKLVSKLSTASTPRARANARREFRGLVGSQDADRSISVNRDPGRFAALRGYDAIEIPKSRSPDNHAEMIILNRGAVIVEEAL